MCWITLTPTKNKKKAASSDCSSAEIVRVHHSPKPRFSDISISLPSSVTSSPDHHHGHNSLHLHPHLPEHLHPHAPFPHGLLHHHHRHAHLHPLHLHPLTPLHGPGKKMKVALPPPPPPTRHSSRPPPLNPHLHPHPHPPAPAPCKPRDPLYRTQIVAPSAVRASTRTALRDVPVRARVNRDVPWDWDCVSSTTGSRVVRGGRARKRRAKGGLKYPPFGGAESWL